ncbi:hypothetical protein AGMMS50293_05970 [Spirochaetia bacterium]|nr:hypothetical protein AGMMS50293_05970 [Spirochaetia bacterium]
MKRAAWNKFVKARDQYRTAIEELRRSLPKLRSVQQKLIDSRTPEKSSGSAGSGKTGNLTYTVETPIVYNGALDDVTSGDEIRLILVADNPGRREQVAENRRYLVGPSGKIAEKFFRDHPGLGIDFRKNAIILNKTPIHTPRTAELRELCRLGSPALAKALVESQRTMARLLLEFHQALTTGADKSSLLVWIIGYSEMKKGGIFETYTEEIQNLYCKNRLKEDILLYRHFSMNQFTIDLNQQAAPKENITESLARIGAAYRQRILGW